MHAARDQARLQRRYGVRWLGFAGSGVWHVGVRRRLEGACLQQQHRYEYTAIGPFARPPSALGWARALRLCRHHREKQPH